MCYIDRSVRAAYRGTLNDVYVGSRVYKGVRLSPRGEAHMRGLLRTYKVVMLAHIMLTHMYMHANIYTAITVPTIERGPYTPIGVVEGVEPMHAYQNDRSNP